MAQYEFMGMPLSLIDEEDVTVSPIAAMIVLKGMDNEGDIVYTMTHTTDLTWIESLGMLEFGKMYVQDKVMTSIVETRSPEEK